MISYAIVGAGNRGASYADWIARHADRAEVVAIVEPRRRQRDQLAARHGVPAERVFASWPDLAAAPRLADAAIVATPDAEHAEPAIALARKGYHLLVEKPLAPTEQECVELVAAVADAGVLFAVCHVLRYRPYTRLVKRLIDEGRLGEIISVQHLEPVGHWHYAHDTPSQARWCRSRSPCVDGSLASSLTFLRARQLAARRGRVVHAAREVRPRHRLAAAHRRPAGRAGVQLRLAQPFPPGEPAGGRRRPVRVVCR